MLAELRKIRYPIEFGLLVTLCFFLPLYEAPKGLASIAYVVTWLVNRLRARDFGGRIDIWDVLIAGWIASGYVVAAFAGLDGHEWIGARDLHHYGLLLWLVKRGGYSSSEIRWLIGTLVASAVVGLFHGYWRWWSGIGKSGTLQLHSVGHVNHTAIYLAIMLGVCASWLFTRWKAWRAGILVVTLAVTALVLVSLDVTASRGAIGVGLALLPLLALVWWPRSHAALAASIVTVVAVVVVNAMTGAEVVQKQQRNVAQENVLSFRDGVWRMSLVAWERYPVFGVGMDNYSLITLERVKTWREEAGKRYERADFAQFPHGHSIYLNTLAERGVIGFAVLVAVLLAWLVWLARFRPRPADDDLDWLLWGCAASAWFVTAAAGTVNTTLHHEHGILAALLLGLWLSRRKDSRAS